MANDGTALGALQEIIESAGGTSDAQTLVPAIEQLGEVIGSGGGGGGGIADGSITTAKLAKYAVTADKLAAHSVGGGSIANDCIEERHLSSTLTDKLAFNSDVDAEVKKIYPIAADAATLQVLQALGYETAVITPKDMGRMYTWPYLRLCWVSNGFLESAPVYFSGNLQTQATTVYARGHSSTASGILGVDESWTIAANA